MKRALPFELVVLLALTAGTVRADLDTSSVRQTAGIFVRTDGILHSVYFDFPAVEVDPSGRFDYSVTFTADMNLYVDGHPISAGKHDWNFRGEGTKGWWLGDSAAAHGKKQGHRYPLSVASRKEGSSWMTADFAPDPDDDALLLRIRLGHEEGTLTLHVSAPAAADDGKAFDLARVKKVRDELRGAAGMLDVAPVRKYAVSALLRDIGDDFTTAEGAGYVRGISVVAGKKDVRFELDAVLPMGRSAATKLGKTIAAGELAKVFDTVGPPIVRASEQGTGVTLTLSAETKTEVWNRRSPVAALVSNDDPVKLSQEVLLLDARLRHVCVGSITALDACQTRLLRATTDYGVVVSKIDPGTPKDLGGGVSVFPVTLAVAGPGSALVSFSRAMEDWRAPMTVDLKSVKTGDFGTELTLRLNFYDYRSLSSRMPGLYSMLRRKGATSRFDRKKTLYLQGIDSAPTTVPPPPSWKRDPYAPPRKGQ